MRINAPIPTLKTTGPLSGVVKAIASKSHVHRLLMAAALADRPTVILCETRSDDIAATMRVLQGLGARFHETPTQIEVTPIGELPPLAQLDCGESGTTLRFMLPILAALGARAHLLRRGRLVTRPLSPLDDTLRSHGVTLSETHRDPLAIEGQLTPGHYEIAANVSSQYIGGLLFALSRLEGVSELTLTATIESLPYIQMTLDVLRTFGQVITHDETMRHYRIEGRGQFNSPGIIQAEGDWSNAAFWLAAGAIGAPGTSLTLTQINAHSLQGDKAMVSLLKAFGADIEQTDNRVRVTAQPLKGITIDAAHIPDLVPILSVVAACAQGKTHFQHIARLRLKESDRVATTLALLHALGIEASATEDSLCVHGGTLCSGRVDGANDHRIVMAAAIASSRIAEGVLIDDPMAVNKSYPHFFDDFEQLGGTVTVWEETL